MKILWYFWQIICILMIILMLPIFAIVGAGCLIILLIVILLYNVDEYLKEKING
jgi:hypothetical protein